MSHKPKPQGYIDNQALNRAQRSARKVLKDIGRIVEEKPSGVMFWHILASISHDLAEVVDALSEMESIRKRS